jgi:hypothetical protein
VFEVQPAAGDDSSDEERAEGGKPLSLVEKHKAQMDSKPKSRREKEREAKKEEEEKAEKLRKVSMLFERALT